MSCEVFVWFGNCAGAFDLMRIVHFVCVVASILLAHKLQDVNCA